MCFILKRGKEREQEDDSAEMDSDVSWQQHQTNLMSTSIQEKGGKRRRRRRKKVSKKSEKYAISDDYRIWPNGLIPYRIDTSLWSSKSAIIKAMRHIESKTCIRFVPARKNERDYIRIYRGGE